MLEDSMSFWTCPGPFTVVSRGSSSTRKTPYPGLRLPATLPALESAAMNPARTGRFPVGMKVVVSENDGDANAGNVAGKRSPGYGVLRVLELPRDTTVKGPGQVQNDIESSNISSPRFTLTLSQF